MDLITFLILGAGLALLIFGADLLVKGASRIASSLGISPLVVGLTVVSFGTSSPELAVSLQSTFNGQPDIAVGNVVGSNIFNVLFILGLSAIIAPLIVNQQLIKIDVPIMIGISVLVYIFGLNGLIGRFEGFILFGSLISYIVFLIIQSRKESKAIEEEYSKEYSVKDKSAKQIILNILFVIVGLALLIYGSDLLVESAVKIAQSFGVSELIIGLTIIAAGTSMPEVAASVVAAFKGEKDIAVGNVVGSNIFNLLCILGLTSIISPSGVNVAPSAISFDIPVMTAIAIACLPIFFTGNSISRWEGFVFLFYYVAYTSYLIMDSTNHDMLPLFNNVMMIFVIPITILTMAVILYRTLKKKNMAG
ncbi:MAG: calcium/sodium antiporter [Melioribacteraceae bacterium]|jgi:cation:H+ antiporter|nr:calcium/sodium antiporter [Melioribacteraceae bacterium]